MDVRLLIEWIIFRVNSSFYNGIFNFRRLNFNIIYRNSFNNFFNGINVYVLKDYIAFSFKVSVYSFYFKIFS